MREYMNQDELEAAYVGKDFGEYCGDVLQFHVRIPDGLLPEVDGSGEIVGFALIDELERYAPWWRPLNRWLLPLETEAVTWSGVAVPSHVLDEEMDVSPSARWIKLSEAARRLSCSTRTLRRWRDAGKVSHADMCRGPGGQWAFRESAVERLVAGD